MTTAMVSAAEIQRAGVTIEPHEAVAIAQQLIDALRDYRGTSVVEPPYGPPSAANVLLKLDGTVICRQFGTTPTMIEVAILLQALLPSISSRVPGGLRYSMARALLEVDVPPFDSLEAFSHSLARFERGPRDEAVRAVLQRFDILRPSEPAPPSRTAPAAVACTVAGLLMIATGKFADVGNRNMPAPAAREARDVVLMPEPAPRARPPIKRASHPVRTEARAARARRPSSAGVLDRLKLRWLRNVFSSRASRADSL